MEQFNYCLVVGQTDVGKKRAANEDNMGNAITPNGLVSVVCDGMGGHVGGATASRIAVDAILENLKGSYYEDPRIAIGESIDIANRAILNEASARPELSGMGSTCVLLIVRNGKVYIGHVGDSRIYLIRSKRIIQLTKDHSYVQMLVDRGEITKEQAEHHPRKNEITNALGIPNMSPATIADDAIIPEAGDCFLLCSDGLSGMVPDSIINKVVSRQSELSAQTRVDHLISIANENGGVDNITAQMVEFTITPGATKTGKKIPLWLKILVPVVVLTAAGFGTYFLLSHKRNNEENNGNKEPLTQCPAVYTTDVKMPGTIFKPNAELVTIVFSPSSIVFKRDGNQIGSESCISFNQDSLKVDLSKIYIVPEDEKTSVLKFTDKNPGDEIIVEISSNEPRKIYRYVFPISKSLGSNPIRIQNIKNPKEDVKPISKDSTAVKSETIKIEIGEYPPEGVGIILFDYNNVASLRINGKDNPEANNKLSGIMLDEVKNDSIVYDRDRWSKEFKPNNRKFVQFKLLGEHNGSAKYTFVIPCVRKGSTDEVILEISLTVVAIKDAETELQDNGHEAPNDSIPQNSEMIPV